MAAHCEKYDQLAEDVERCLDQIAQTTTEQLQAFQSDDHATLMRLDKKLEQMMGSKERAIGALREHRKEHGCHGPQWSDLASS